jgi:hypothetical protein
MNLIFHDLLGIIVEVYIDDTIVKSAGQDSHSADLHLAFERMCRFGLKMNPLKYAFGVSVGKFLGFVIHENVIEIDPKKIEAIQKVQAPTCKRDVQKFIGKVNFLRRFIANLSDKLIPFTPILWLKDGLDLLGGQSNKQLLIKLSCICLHRRYWEHPRVENHFGFI